jgi:site-specific recombinase XerD
MKPTNFAKCLTDFLSSELPGQKGVSVNTIKSYRDTFSILLAYCRDIKNIKIEKLTLAGFDGKLIADFLTWLETERGNSVATRNQRLAAIHSFCHYVQTEEPGALLQCQQIINIKMKKHKKPHVGYVSAQSLKDILSEPDLNTKNGRRDLVIISLLYDTGARVSELINLSVRDVRLDEFPIVQLDGKKSGKARQVPLMKKTAVMLRDYLKEHNLNSRELLDHPLFFNNRRERFTRPGITYILQKYTGDSKLTPHILRHTKAMHLLQSGVNIVYIRDILGHVDLKTTEVYARADTEMKRKAMENVYQELIPDSTPNWNDDVGLSEWLKNMI